MQRPEQNDTHTAFGTASSDRSSTLNAISIGSSVSRGAAMRALASIPNTA
jgi:hypothetical protein